MQHSASPSLLSRLPVLFVQGETRAGDSMCDLQGLLTFARPGVCHPLFSNTSLCPSCGAPGGGGGPPMEDSGKAVRCAHYWRRVSMTCFVPTPLTRTPFMSHCLFLPPPLSLSLLDRSIERAHRLFSLFFVFCLRRHFLSLSLSWCWTYPRRHAHTTSSAACSSSSCFVLGTCFICSLFREPPSLPSSLQIGASTSPTPRPSTRSADGTAASLFVVCVGSQAASPRGRG